VPRSRATSAIALPSAFHRSVYPAPRLATALHTQNMTSFAA
jgi:hypothetical protein